MSTMHTKDIPHLFPEAPPYRAELLPAWVKGIAAMIFLLSLPLLYGLADGLYLHWRIGFATDDYLLLCCALLGICSGVSAAGLLMEYRWGLPYSLLTATGTLIAFLSFLGFDLFFYRRIMWGFVGMEVMILAVTLFYIRALWKIKEPWKSALQSDLSRKKNSLN